MKIEINLIVVTAAIAMSIPVLANDLIFTPPPTDISIPNHSCIKPYKPFKFNSQWDLDNYNNGIQRYKSCIFEYIEEQNKAAEKHRQAANDAIEDWNHFVKYEIN